MKNFFALYRKNRLPSPTQNDLSTQKNFLYSLKRTTFHARRKASYTFLKKFQTLPRKQTNKFLIITRKIQNFLYLSKKTYSLYFHGKDKALYFRCVLITSMLFMYISKTSVSLYLWNSFIFSYFVNFFYTERNFVFHLLRDFYIVCNHIVVVWFFFRNLLILFKNFF